MIMQELIKGDIMKISFKLILGFGIIIAALMILLFTSIMRMEDLSTSSEQINLSIAGTKVDLSDYQMTNAFKDDILETVPYILTAGYVDNEEELMALKTSYEEKLTKIIEKSEILAYQEELGKLINLMRDNANLIFENKNEEINLQERLNKNGVS